MMENWERAMPLLEAEGVGSPSNGIWPGLSLSARQMASLAIRAIHRPLSRGLRLLMAGLVGYNPNGWLAGLSHGLGQHVAYGI